VITLIRRILEMLFITLASRVAMILTASAFRRRSMGDRRRVTPDDPRLMENEDYRDGQKAKVIQNPEALRTSCHAYGDPIVPPEQVESPILPAAGRCTGFSVLALSDTPADCISNRI